MGKSCVVVVVVVYVCVCVSVCVVAVVVLGDCSLCISLGKYSL